MYETSSWLIISFFFLYEVTVPSQGIVLQITPRKTATHFYEWLDGARLAVPPAAGYRFIVTVHKRHNSINFLISLLARKQVLVELQD